MLKDMREVVDRERDGTVDFYFGGNAGHRRGGSDTSLKMPDVFRAALLVIMLIILVRSGACSECLLPVVTGS